jgi:N-acetylmuramoyl-L-alanine amidase
MGKRTLFGLILLVALLAALLAPDVASGARKRATIYWGSTGPDVRVAQQKLHDWGYYKGNVDGVFLKLTYNAVVGFQKKNGLRVDGVVGPQTWAALGEYGGEVKGGGGGGSSKPQGAIRQSDKDLLARLVSAEAKGEPYEGQVAVAAVILNRMRDSRFPHTLQGVVYQKDAFEPVSNGTIYQPPTASAVKATEDALNGWDPSYGALYFWNPATASSPWIWSRTITLRIGHHVFGK